MSTDQTQYNRIFFGVYSGFTKADTEKTPSKVKTQSIPRVNQKNKP